MPRHSREASAFPEDPTLRLTSRRSFPVAVLLLSIVLSLASRFETYHAAADPATLGPSTSSAPTATPNHAPTWNVTAIPAATSTSTTVPTATITWTSAPAATATSTATSDVPLPEQTPPRHYVVLLVIDGSQTSYLSLAKLPHIRALIQNGTVYDNAYVGELESSTPGVHVTLGVGTYPRESGFLGFGWADPVTRQYVDFRTLLADRAIDPVLKHLPVPSVAARLHQFIPNARSIAGSGHKDYAAIGLGGGASDYVLYGHMGTKSFTPEYLHTPPPLTAQERARLTISMPLQRGQEDAYAFNYALTVARHVKPRLLMLNLPESDTWGHWFGPAARGVFRNLMINIDQGVGRIEDTYRKLGILNQTDFIITADHAMMQSKSAWNWGLVRTAATKAGAKVARADGAGGGVWLQDPRQAHAVADALVADRPQHVMAIFYRSAPGNDYHYIQASPTSWVANHNVEVALQDLTDTTAGINGPDIWVLYRENYTVLTTNTSGKWHGTHGGATWRVQHIPMILSGPGIKRGFVSHFPARAVDVAPTMERLLGLPAIRRDGVILSDALVSPLPHEGDRQRAIAPMLSQDVKALELQSTIDRRKVTFPSFPPALTQCPKKGKPLPGQRCVITPDMVSNG